MRYHSFDLWIATEPDGSLSLRSSCEEHGEFRDKGAFDVASVQRDAARLARVHLAQDDLIQIGARLYGDAFATGQGQIEWHFGQCWGAATRDRSGVRVRLRVEQPLVATIAWELVYSRRLASFMGVSARSPIVRYVELPIPIGTLDVDLPVRMLVVAPHAPDLNSAVEVSELRTMLQGMGGAVELTVLDESVTRRRLVETLETRTFHVLHFIGHGDFDGDKAVLFLNAEDGSLSPIDASTLGAILRNHDALKLIVLNSCRGAELSPNKPLVGMAAQLVQGGVPAVIAMQYPIRDREAVTFARALYHTLFVSDDRGRVEVAVSQARNALAIEFPDTTALALPVLFTHARDGVLFDLATGSSLRDFPLSRTSLTRVEAVRDARKRNVELLSEGAEGSVDAGAVAREREGLARVERRLSFRNGALIAAFAVALFTFFLATWLGFPKLRPELRVESYAVWLTDRLHHHELSSGLVLVAIDSASEARYGPLGSSWRGRHAQLIDRLSAAGARVIAFSNFFTTPSPYDTVMAASIRRAAGRAGRPGAGGTTVLVASNTYSGGRADLTPALAQVTRASFNCMGDNAVHSLKMIPLVVSRVSPGAGEERRYRSLTLETVAAYYGTGIDDAGADFGIRFVGSRENDGVRPSELIEASSVDTGCKAISPGDTLSELYVAYSPLRSLRTGGRRLSYKDVIADSTRLPDLQGRVVLVGLERPDGSNVFSVRRGLGAPERRYGLELFADAVNTLLTGEVIRPLGGVLQFLIIVVMALAGAVVAGVRLPGGVWGRSNALIVGAVAYLAGAMWLYASKHLLLNTVFHLAAMALTFATVSLIKRKWFA